MLTISRTKTVSIPKTPRSFLATMDLFKKVPAEALAVLEKKMIEKKYAKHESIFLDGDPAESVWFVKEGHVKAAIHAASGRCQTLCMVGAKGMFGSCCAMGGGQYSCHSVAETDVTVISIPMADFLPLLSKYPDVSMALVAHLSCRLRQSKDMQTFDQESVEKRILHVLVELTKDFGNTIPLTRREIAEMVGTTVESSIRTFSRLESEKLVATERGKITVRSVEELKCRLEEEL